MKNCEHVVIFGLDAIGTYICNADTPNIDRIFGDGAYTRRALCSRPSGSPEGWGSIFTGTSADCHGLYWPVYANDSTRLQPSIFKLLRDALPDAVMGSFCDWRDINDYMLENDIGIDKRNLSEDEIVKQGCAYLIEKRPTLLFTYFEAPDDIGHTYGFDTVPFYESITKCDRFIGELFAAAEKAAMTKDNTLFILIGDHGGISYAHGCWHDLEKYVYMGICGCGVNPTDLGEVNIRDVAAIVLHALNIPLPAFDRSGWTAQIPSGLFSDGSGNDYRQVVTLHRNMPETLPCSASSPQFASPDGLGGIFGDKAPILALTFDADANDASGRHTTVRCYRDGVPIEHRIYGSKGTQHVRGGAQGNCMQFDRDGYLAIPNLCPGTQSFSAAFWYCLETDLAIQQQLETVFSNNTYGVPESDGFNFKMGDSLITLSLCSDGICTKLGRNEQSITVGAHRFPEEFDGGWMHMIVVVDRENELYRLFCGFKELGSERIPHTLYGKSLDGCGTLRLGQQTNEATAYSNRHLLDDFLWFDRALTDSDIEKLYRYYYKTDLT